MKEKSCVYKFIERSQKSFREGGSLHDVRQTIPPYKTFIKKAYGPMKGRVAHNLATSSFGLNALAAYEFSRYKGVPLPNANTIVQLIFPLSKKSAEVLHNDSTINNQSFEKTNIFETKDTSSEKTA